LTDRGQSLSKISEPAADIYEAIERRDGQLAAVLPERATVAALGAIEAGGWSGDQYGGVTAG